MNLAYAVGQILWVFAREAFTIRMKASVTHIRVGALSIGSGLSISTT
jgi:hypothetical protein